MAHLSGLIQSLLSCVFSVSVSKIAFNTFSNKLTSAISSAYPENANGEIRCSSQIFELIIAVLWASLSDLSRVRINRIALRGSPVFVPIVSENSLDNPLPQIT